MENNNQPEFTDKHTEEVLSKFEKIKREIISYVLIIVGVFAFKSSFVEPNHIPSGSMLPTNAIGDFILVNKMAYGFKVPYSDLFGDPIYLTKSSRPERGDIIVFRYPEDPSILFVKRVIGLPGDEIEVVNNRVWLKRAGEAEAVEMSAVPVDPKEHIELFDEKFGPSYLEFKKVTLDNKKEFITAAVKSEYAPYHLNTRGVVKVPKDSFFVMGDNRDNSSDSRKWGFVPFKYVRGKAMFVWFNMVYPWSREKFHFRPWRIGTTL